MARFSELPLLTHKRRVDKYPARRFRLTSTESRYYMA